MEKSKRQGKGLGEKGPGGKGPEGNVRKREKHIDECRNNRNVAV